MRRHPTRHTDRTDPQEWHWSFHQPVPASAEFRPDPTGPTFPKDPDDRDLIDAVNLIGVGQMGPNSVMPRQWVVSPPRRARRASACG